MNRTLSPRHRLKRAVVLVHIWLGISLGAVWALQGLSGALLVFHRDLDRPVIAGASGRLGLDRLIAAASEKAQREPESIGLYYPDPRVLGVTFAGYAGGKASVLVEASTGRVLATRARTPISPGDGNFWRWIYTFHHEIFAHERGQTLLGISGVFLLTMAASGAWLAWPRRGHWRASFAMSRWRTRSQQLFGWHRCVGLLATIALALLSLTGALMDFGKPLRSWAEHNAGYRAPYRPTPTAALPASMIGAERAWRVAQGVFPQSALSAVNLPSAKSPVYQVRLRMPGEWRQWSGTSSVTVDPSNGAVLASYDASRGPLANLILDSAFPVHNGEIAGPAGRVFVFLAGLSLPVLYVSGLWAWLRRRRFAHRAPWAAAERLPNRLQR